MYFKIIILLLFTLLKIVVQEIVKFSWECLSIMCLMRGVIYNVSERDIEMVSFHPQLSFCIVFAQGACEKLRD